MGKKNPTKSSKAKSKAATQTATHPHTEPDTHGEEMHVETGADGYQDKTPEQILMMDYLQ